MRSAVLVRFQPSCSNTSLGEITDLSEWDLDLRPCIAHHETSDDPVHALAAPLIVV